MNRTNVAMFCLFAASVFSAPALAADTSGCSDMAKHRSADHRFAMQDMRDFAARAERRLAHFKDELKITPQQEAAWNAYADKVKQVTGSGVKMMHDKFADASLSATERMERMNGVMRERLASMESVTESFKRLYASLTADQKLLADNHMSHMNRMGPHDQPVGDAPGMHPHE